MGDAPRSGRLAAALQSGRERLTEWHDGNIAKGGVCDFCCGPLDEGETCWQTSGDINQQVSYLDHGTGEAASTTIPYGTDWAACLACDALIAAGDEAGLIERVEASPHRPLMEEARAMLPPETFAAFEAECADDLRRLYRRIFELNPHRVPVPTTTNQRGTTTMPEAPQPVAADESARTERRTVDPNAHARTGHLRPDDVIAIRKQWVRATEVTAFQGPSPLPGTTVLASSDWLAYVCAMADAVPEGHDLLFPSEEDVKWPWPGGVAIVFDEPIKVEHMIISRDQPNGSVYTVKPRVEAQLTRGLVIGTQKMVTAAIKVGDVKVVTGMAASPDDRVVEVESYPLAWFGDDPYDIVTGRWLPNTVMHAIHSERISQASRMLLSVLTAMGHRLTRLDDPETTNRGERRRIHRDLPSLRVIRLASGASAKRSEGAGTVEWSKRWIVRGHWHTVVHGPNRSLRKVQWFDPYVKGPEDKPLDTRDTIWKA